MTTRRTSSSSRALVVLLALALVASACSDDDDSTTSTTAPADATTSSAPDGSASAGCDDGTVQEGDDGAVIAEIVEAAGKADDLTSVVYRVTRGDEVVAAGAVGDSLTGIPADQAMHFRNGNVAFAYLGTLLLLMVEEGEAELDDPVSKWLPELDVPNADEVTLQMLVQNTSGYPDYVPSEAFQTAFLADPFGEYTPQELIDFGFAEAPDGWYPPGTSWNYAHTNYVILGEALAAIGGAPLDELLVDRVIEPMGLVSTAPALTPVVPEPVLHTFSTERGVLEDTTFWNPSWQTSPGSVITTNMCDLAASATAVGTGELLSDESFEAMTTPDTVEFGPTPAGCPENLCRPLREDFYYGLGVIIWADWIVQTPLFGGAGAVHAYLPAEDLTVAMVAVTGAESEAGVNYAQQIWTTIATELTPGNVPTR